MGEDEFTSYSFLRCLELVSLPTCVSMIYSFNFIFCLKIGMILDSATEVWTQCCRRGEAALKYIKLRFCGSGFKPGHRVVSLDEKLYCTLSHFTQVYKWFPTQ